jgi:hypothetical protein
MLFDWTFPCYFKTFGEKKCLSGKVICAIFCPAYRSSPVTRNLMIFAFLAQISAILGGVAAVGGGLLSRGNCNNAIELQTCTIFRNERLDGLKRESTLEVARTG